MTKRNKLFNGLAVTAMLFLAVAAIASNSASVVAQEGGVAAMTMTAEQSAMLDYLPPQFPWDEAVSIYVDDDAADDTGDCLTPETACPTIEHGIMRAWTYWNSSPIVFRVAPGTYIHPVDGVFPGDLPFEFGSYPLFDGIAYVGSGGVGGETIIDMRNMNRRPLTFSTGFPDGDVSINDISVVEGFTIIGDEGPTGYGVGIEHMNGGTVVIRNNKISGFHAGVEVVCAVCNQAMTIMSNNIFISNRYGITPSTIAGSSPYIAYNNVFDGNAVGAISQTPENIIQNNVFMNNGVGVRTWHHWEQWFNYNTWWANGLDLESTASTKHIGNINGDPVLDADYRPLAGSPVIDAGDPDTLFNDPDGSRNDIGAYGGPDAIPAVSVLNVIDRVVITHPVTDNTQHVVDYTVNISSKNNMPSSNVVMTVTLPIEFVYTSSNVSGAATVEYDATEHIVRFTAPLVEQGDAFEAHVFMAIETEQTAAFPIGGELTWHEGRKEFSAVAITNPFQTFLPIIQKE